MTQLPDARTQQRREQARQRTARQRRLALGAVAIAAAGIGVWIGSGSGSESGDDGSSDQRAAQRKPPSCPPPVASTPRLLAGQMLVVRFEGTATPELVRAARRGEIGGVIAFPPPGLPADGIRNAITRLQTATRAGGNPPLLVATDQEGGEVKRFPLAPPDTGAPELGSAGEAAALSSGRATGRYLAGLGINSDLAPVLDVPSSTQAFMSSRSFGSDPGLVSDVGVAFARGLAERDVAATAKHFPGLGRASVNTDLSPSVVQASRQELASDLEPFRAAIGAEVPLLMTSNATYPAYDPNRPASLSPRVDRLLRGELGFEGVAITDDLLSGAISGAGYGAGDAAVAAAAAGADLLLFARLPAPEALPALVSALRRGTLDREALLSSCIRNLALRESLTR